MIDVEFRHMDPAHGARLAAEVAEGLGLHLTTFNAGAKNSANGFRLFDGAGPHHHFEGGEIAHFSTLSEVKAFLAGYRRRGVLLHEIARVSVDPEGELLRVCDMLREAGFLPRW